MAGGIQPGGPWYDDAVEWLSRQIRKFQAGELGGGSLASREMFSLPAAIVSVLLLVSFFLLMRIQLPKRNRNRQFDESEQLRQQSTIQFYAAALEELARVGIHRRHDQTPGEFALVAADEMARFHAPSIAGPMERLTETFYRHRFGGKVELDDDDQRAIIEADLTSIKASVNSRAVAGAEPDQAAKNLNL